MNVVGRLAGAYMTFLVIAAVSPAADNVDSLVGRWVSANAEKHPLEFEKDGTFRYGWEKSASGWVLATGKYTVEANGKIKGTIEREGVKLGTWYMLKGAILQGPRGPDPKVTWRRVDKK